MRAPAPRVALVALAVALFAAGLAVIAIRSGDGGGGKLRASATTSTSPTITTAPDTSTSAAPTTTRPVPPALQQTFSQIQDQVAQLRGLPWLAPLDIKALPEADFLREFNAANQRDIHPDRLQGDGETLKLLKLIPQSADYVKAYYALLNAAVLGFYDPKTTKLFVRANGATLTPLQRITVAHEMDHALTDQHFKYGPPTDALDKADKGEQETAWSALLEGDAKTLEAQWGTKFLSAKEQQAAANEGNSSASSILSSPRYLLDSLYFPYTDGKDFVISRFRKGGWASVDAAYQRPPDSTQAVIHPSLYNAGKTWATPAFPDLAAATGCAPVRANTFGEFSMTELLRTHLDPSTASDAADGWSGDFYATVRCGSARGFADRWTAPDTAAAGKLASALSSWAADWSGGHTKPAADGRFSGPAGAGRLVVADTRVDLILADDGPTADKVNAALGD